MATLRHGTGLFHGFHVGSRNRAHSTSWYGELAWVGAAALLGFATTELLAPQLQLSRR